MATIIDAHAHWYSDECLAAVAQDSSDLELLKTADGARALRYRGSLASFFPPFSGDLDARCALMDDLGVQTQLLSFGAVDVGWAGDRQADVARRVNDLFIDVCRARPGRFRFLASVPLDDARRMRAELDRALAAGAVGIGVTTTVGGRPLDAPEFRALWAVANDLGTPVYVHPCFPASGPRDDGGGFLMTGFPGETGLAATRLVLGGILEEFPRVPVIWSHLGGSLLASITRLDAGYRRFPTCPRPPSTYLARCYYDTVTNNGPALEAARALFGVDQLLFGTDEPHRLEPPREILDTVRERPWSDVEIAAVLGTSAERLFLGARAALSR
jgi:predicted TIM-barrel fold metal-dependent hydrolase